MNALTQEIFDLIAKEGSVERDKISLDSTMQDLNVHSLDAVQIVFAIEDKYNITLPEHDPSVDTNTVRGLVDAVERLVAAKNGAPAVQKAA